MKRTSLGRKIVNAGLATVLAASNSGCFDPVRDESGKIVRYKYNDARTTRALSDGVKGALVIGSIGLPLLGMGSDPITALNSKITSMAMREASKNIPSFHEPENPQVYQQKTVDVEKLKEVLTHPFIIQGQPYIHWGESPITEGPRIARIGLQDRYVNGIRDGFNVHIIGETSTASENAIVKMRLYCLVTEKDTTGKELSRYEPIKDSNGILCDDEGYVGIKGIPAHHPINTVHFSNFLQFSDRELELRNERPLGITILAYIVNQDGTAAGKPLQAPFSYNRNDTKDKQLSRVD